MVVNFKAKGEVMRKRYATEALEIAIPLIQLLVRGIGINFCRRSSTLWKKKLTVRHLAND